tara:strand:- start:776 stop:1030 length:255 start_codon:yes stop_codon:yes gene_type:complete
MNDIKDLKEKIVEGRFHNGLYFGTFLFVGFRVDGNTRWATVKEVNPLDWSQMLPEKLSLPVDCLVPIGSKMTVQQQDRLKKWHQ